MEADEKINLEHDKTKCDYCGLEIINEGDDLFENYFETDEGHYACNECYDKWCNGDDMQLRENWDEGF